MKKPADPKKRNKRPLAPLPQKALLPRTQKAFPIVGIGASAGGLEALELFLKHVPEWQIAGQIELIYNSRLWHLPSTKPAFLKPRK